MIYDSTIIGGGFFGIRLALLLAKKKQKVLLLEQQESIFKHASSNNQARVHNGYHYPRNHQTALSSHKNYRRFIQEFQDCTYSKFQSIYAVAQNSFTNSQQFESFCDRLELPLKKIKIENYGADIFNSDLISCAYLVDEIVFDTNKLKIKNESELKNYSENITIELSTTVEKLIPSSNSVEIKTTTGTFLTNKVFNVSYAGINTILSNSALQTIPLKFEIAEICLVNAPLNFRDLGLTIVDGAFFSCIPHPSKNCHSLSHVKYTPHYYWLEDELACDPYKVLSKKNCKTNFLHMKKDSERYVPILTNLTHRDSIFDIKTVVARNEQDDGRPIVLKKHSDNIFSILGTKLDNIYDLEKRIEEII